MKGPGSPAQEKELEKRGRERTGQKSLAWIAGAVIAMLVIAQGIWIVKDMDPSPFQLSQRTPAHTPTPRPGPPPRFNPPPPPTPRPGPPPRFNPPPPPTPRPGPPSPSPPPRTLLPGEAASSPRDISRLAAAIYLLTFEEDPELRLTVKQASILRERITASLLSESLRYITEGGLVPLLTKAQVNVLRRKSGSPPIIKYTSEDLKAALNYLKGRLGKKASTRIKFPKIAPAPPERGKLPPNSALMIRHLSELKLSDGQAAMIFPLLVFLDKHMVLDSVFDGLDKLMSRKQLSYIQSNMSKALADPRVPLSEGEAPGAVTIILFELKDKLRTQGGD